jgi:Carboxypeptidase regulatory-like domain
MRLVLSSLAALVALSLQAIPAPAAAVAPATISLRPAPAPAALSGRVVDSRRNDPLQGVKVIAYPEGSTVAEASTITDDQGRFTLTDLRGGDYRLLFEHTGYPKSLAGGIGVKSGDHLVLIAAFALRANPSLQDVRMVDQCGSLIQPGQTADVYVICSGH